MPWCPNCNEEYVEGISLCADCGAPLEADPPPRQITPLVEKLEGEDWPLTEERALLLTVNTDQEADLTAALLRSGGIPVHKDYQGAGSYLRAYTGFTVYGVDLYVPKSMLEQAGLLADLPEGGEVDFQAEIPHDAQGEPSLDQELEQFQRRKPWLWILLLCFPALLAWLLIFVFFR